MFLWEQDVQLLELVLSGTNELQYLLHLPLYEDTTLQAAAGAGFLEVAGSSLQESTLMQLVQRMKSRRRRI